MQVTTRRKTRRRTCWHSAHPDSIAKTTTARIVGLTIRKRGRQTRLTCSWKICARRRPTSWRVVSTEATPRTDFHGCAPIADKSQTARSASIRSAVRVTQACGRAWATWTGPCARSKKSAGWKNQPIRGAASVSLVAAIKRRSRRVRRRARAQLSIPMHLLQAKKQLSPCSKGPRIPIRFPALNSGSTSWQTR